MATIKNIIQTIFTSQGAGSSITDVDNLGRAQTRLGQASAGAGRSFAAQSQGLGGLVAAYAGAAATTFALQQAYDKLAKSARAMQTIEGLNTLAASAAIDGKVLLQNVQILTKYQMSMAGTAEQINLALSAGFDSSQIEGLSTVALKASRALGRDLTDAMTRVTRGSAKMETELLDELGIYTKIGPSTRAYAASIGKTSSELTEYERRQAFVNSVIAEGNKKFQAINTTIPTTAEKIEAFGTKIVDLATRFGMAIAEVVAPAMSFLTDNISAAFSAFGLLTSLVAGKGLAVFREGLDKATKSAVEFGNTVERKISGIGGATKVLRDASSEIRSFNEQNMRLNFEEKAQYAAIKKTAEARQLNRAEVNAATNLLGTHISKLDAEKTAIKANYDARYANIKALRVEQQEARRSANATKVARDAKLQSAASATSFADRAFDNAQATALTQRLAAEQAKLAQKTAQVKQAIAGARSEYTRISGPLNTVSASLEEARIAQSELNTALGNRFIKAGAAASQVWAGLVKGATGFTGAITSAAGKAMGLFQFVMIFNLIGSSIANVLGKSVQYEAFIANITSSIRSLVAGSDNLNTSKVTQGLAAGSLADLERIDSKIAQIDTFKFKDKFLFLEIDVEKTKEQLTAEVADILTKMSSDEPGKRLGEALTSGAAGWGAAIGGIVLGVVGGIFAGPGGVMVGAQLGGAIGAGLGAWLSAGTSVLKDAADEYGDKVRERFSEQLAQIADPELQTKTLQGLSLLFSKYSELAMVNPQARAALDAQAKMILQSAESTQFVEAFSQIMQSTGLTSDVISKNFQNVTTSAQKASGYLSSFSILLQDREVKFTFIDQYSEEFKNILALFDGSKNSSADISLNVVLANKDKLKGAIDNIYGNVDNYSGALSQALTQLETLSKIKGIDLSSIDAKDFIMLSKELLPQAKDALDAATAAGVNLIPVLQAVGNSMDYKAPITDSLAALDAAQQQSIRTAQAIQILNEGVASGSITYEDYTKRIGETRSGLQALENDISKAQSAQDAIAELITSPDIAALPKDQYNAFIRLFFIGQDRLAQLEEQLTAERAVHDNLKAQDETLKKILNTQTLITSITPKKKTSQERYFALTTAGLSEEEKTLANMNLAAQVLEQNKAALTEYLNFQSQVAGANETLQTTLLSTTVSNAESQMGAIKALAAGASATFDKTNNTITASAKDGGSTVINLVSDATKASADLALSALESLFGNAQQAYEQTVTFMKKKTEEYAKAVASLKEEAKSLANDKLKLTLEIEINKAKASRDLQNTLNQLKLEKLQLELSLVQAKGESGTLSKKDSLDEQNKKEIEILDFRKQLLDIERDDAKWAAIETLKTAELTSRINKDKIESEKNLQLSAIAADRQYVTTMTTVLQNAAQAEKDLLASRVTATNQQNQKFIDGLSDVFTQGAAAIAQAIITFGTNPGTVSSPTVTVDYTAPDITGYFTNVTEGFTKAADDYEAQLRTNAATRTALEDQALQAARDTYIQEINQANAIHKAKTDNLEIEKSTQSENSKARINDLAKESGESAKKAEEARNKIVEAYKDINKNLQDSIRTVAKEIVSFVGGILVNLAQSRVDNLKAQETQLQDALAVSTSKLNDVSSRLEQTLSQETSQREELLSITKDLAESNKEYVKSLGSQDRNVQASSDTYVQNLLKQKRAIIDLASSTRKAVALSATEKKLSTINSSLQEQLNDTTFARMDAEERLVATQGMVQVITDSVTASSEGLAQGLINLRSAMMAMLEVTGMVSGSEMGAIAQQANMSDAFGALSGAVNNFKEGVTSLKKVNGNYVTASGKTVANVEKFNSTMNTVSNVIGGAVSGFNIGSSIATALGVSGFATQIGGAIGGIITSGAMGAAITTAITSGLGVAVGSLGATLISFAVPIIGPIIGALVGSLFAKKPKAGASTGFDASGEFVTTGAYASGGGSEKGYADIMKSTYTSFFGSLEEFGIELQKQGKNFGFAIDTAKKRMTASFTKNGEKILSQQISSGEEAAKFFIDAFLKTFDKGDLVVKSSVAYAENLQSAIDNFATKAKDQRTEKIFSEYLQFATKFTTKIAELRGPATSTADAIDLIKESAKANTAQLTQFYTSFLDKTREVFGESSKEYGVAGAAVRKNALAQLGLADSANKSTGDFIALSDAMESVDAGTVMVENAVASINAFADTMRAVGQFSDSEISNAISKSREVTLTSIVTNANESLKAGIDMLENPANEAVSTIVSVTDNAASRVSNLQGTYNALIANSATEAQKSIAASNIALSNQLSKLEITSVLNSLSDAELKAVVAAEEKIDATIREEAATRLAAVSASKFAKAQVKIADIGRRIASELSDLPALPNIVTSVADLMDLFEVDTVTPFVNNFSDLVNSIARGENITSNFDASLTALTSEFNSGAITADQYTEGLDLVVTSTLDVISTLEDMISKYEDLAGEIYSAYQAQVDAVTTAAENLGTQLTDMLDGFGSATTEILRIYDTSLASVAKSGNELFDLEDSAKSAFETAAKAVKEFETANKLSGKSSSTVLADITSIQQQLNDLSSKPFDLSSLLQFSKLSSQQRALQSEYNKLTTVEKEYNSLLADRASAQEDLAFATATIDSLSSTLIDTRRTESEIVQKVQDAAVSYARSQENLNDITKLLTESNFNLNQVRSEETDAVSRTIILLGELRTAFVGLTDTTAQILSSESKLQEQLIAAARENYQIRLDLANEAERTSMAPMETFLAGVREYYKQLETAAVGIQGMLENPINSLSDSLKAGVQEVTAFNLKISDQFGSFSADISKYINLATASENIKNFAQSLDITQNRFAILASDSGPLSSLNGFLIETYNTIGLLTESGNYLDLSFERVRTAFGSIFTAIGTDTEGLNAAVVNISLVGDQAVASLSNVSNYIKEFATQVGAVKVSLTNIDAQNIPVLLQSLNIDVSPLKQISDLVQVVNLVDANVGTLNLSNLNSFAGTVSNIVTGINSTLGGLNLNLSSNISTDITNFIYGLGDVLDVSISLDLKDQVQSTVRTYVYSVGNSVTNLNVDATLAESARATIETYVSSMGTASVNTTVNSTLKESAELLISNYVSSVGTASLDTTISSSLKDSAVQTIQNYVSSLGNASAELTVSSTLSEDAVLAISNYVKAVGEGKADIKISGSKLKDEAVLAVQNYISTINKDTSSLTVAYSTDSGLGLNIRTWVSDIVKGKDITVTYNTETSNTLANAMSSFVSKIVSGNGITAVYNTATVGTLANTISSFVSKIVNGNDISATYNTTTAGTLANTLSAFTAKVVSGDGITAVYNTTTTGTLANTISSFAAKVVSGDGIALDYNTATTGTLANTLTTFVGKVRSGEGITMAYSTATAGTLANTVSAFTTKLINGEGITLSYNTATAGTLANTVSAFFVKVVNGDGITATYNTATVGTLANTISAFTAKVVKGEGITMAYSISTADTLAKGISDFVNKVVKGDSITATYNTATADTLANTISAFATKIVKGDGITVSYNTATNGTLANTISAFAAKVVAGDGITLTYNAATASTLANTISAFATKIVSGDGITLSYNTATASTLANTISSFAAKVVKGEGITMSYSITTADTLAKGISDFVGKVVKGDSITAAYNIATAGTLANNISAFTAKVVSGDGITLSYNTTTTGTLANTISAFTAKVANGDGITLTYNTATSNTLAKNISDFLGKVVKGDGITLTYNTATASTLANSINTFTSDIVSGKGISLAYGTTTTNTLAKNINDFVGKVVSGDGISAAYDVTTTGKLPLRLKQFVDSVVGGTGISTTFDIATAASLAGRISGFIGSVVNGTGITLSYSTTTQNSLAAKMSSFATSVTNGTGIDLSYNVNTAGSLANSVNTYITSFKTAISTAMSGIQTAFSGVTPVVESLRLALTGVAADGKDITTTQGLIEAIKDVNSGTGVSALTSSFKTLRDAITPLLDTVSGTKTLDGPLTAFKTKLDSIKASIQTEWNNLQISATGTSSTNPGFVRIVTGTTRDPNTDALKTIADNSGKYPKLVGPAYTATPGSFAEGGYVQGPGSATSDSIPANLSNGEFVVKASAVKNIGLDALSAINSGMPILDIMAGYGRFGDTMLAHITPEEAELLKMRGGAGTMNPMTNLPEFYNKDAGAVGSIFAQQEKDLLWKTYGDKFLTSNFQSNFGPDPKGTPEAVNMTANAWNPWGDNLWADQYYYKMDGTWAPGDNGLFAWDNKNKLIDSQRATISLANEVLKARDQPITDFSQFAYAQDWFGYDWGNRWGVNKSITNKSEIQTGWGPYRRQVRNLFSRPMQDFPEVNGGWKAKSGQALSQFINDSLANGGLDHQNNQVTSSLVSAAVDAANAKNPNFTDLYMLGDTNPEAGRPTAAMLTSGGLVTDEFSASTARDSVNALLEPGEFVLRKQAVDRMGLDNAIRLNSTGDTGGDTEVEVNINNNGTSQTTIGTPEVRRENGKIVIDIILEDLRTNGPINRQIRSIR